MLNRTFSNKIFAWGQIAMQREFILFIFALVSISSRVLATEEKKKTFSYDHYAAVLKNYVDDQSLVNYKKLKAKPQRLENFVAAIGKLAPNSYNKWNDKEKIAFWLNAYNALTLKAIIDNYPIKSSFFRSRVYPRNSIRQISGVWDRITFSVMGKDLTLEHIEHKILRKEFSEPRIHLALVCAAKGCPPLRSEPYTGKKLDEQLGDQSRKFLANPEKFRFDSLKRVLHISPIFKWFGDDFIKITTKKKPFIQYSNKEAAILEFVSKYLAEDHAFFKPSRKAIRIKYFDYDWSLNEQR